MVKQASQRSATVRVCALLLIGVVSGCKFNLDRSLGPGEIRGKLQVPLPDGGVTGAAGASVHLVGSNTITADSNGAFTFRGLGAGTYEVDVTYDPQRTGHPIAILAVPQLTMTAGDGIDLGTVTLVVAGSVHGNVLLTGQKIPNAALTLVDANGNALPGLPPAMSDATGVYQIPYAPAGTAYVRALYVDSGNTLIATSAGFPVSPRVVSTQDITLMNAMPAPSGTLEGQVSFENGVQAPAQVTITITQGPTLIRTQTVASMQPFSISGLPPGVYTVTISAPGLAPVVFTEVVLAGPVNIGTAVFSGPDPCLTSNGGCAQGASCDSSTGSAVCTCPAGQVGNGMTCEPDPCQTSNGGCDPHATCDGSSGMPQCMCPAGYSGTGTTCSPNVVSIAVSAPAAMLMVGQTEQLTATATYFDNSTGDVTAKAMWSSANPEIAAISSSGLVTANSLGTTMVSAMFDGFSASTSIAVASSVVAPTNLVYAVNPVTFNVGVAAPPDVPSNTGGMPTSYAIQPALPGGLTFDTTTGVIAGTPSALAALTQYTVTATNSAGSTTAMLGLQVLGEPPSDLTYTVSTIAAFVGQAISPDAPGYVGMVTSFSVSPALPAGLMIDPAIGIISGTPTMASAAQQYTVSASNTAGSTTAPLTISVTQPPPTAFVYIPSTIMATLGQPLLAEAPGYNGPVATFTIAPALPSGLMIDSSTGAISGTPTMRSAPQVYTVTATNTGGSTHTQVTISVVDVPPNVTYSPAMQSFTVGEMVDITPQNTGGQVVSWTISPALPSWLSFDTTTGIISGTAQALFGPTTFMIGATNTGGGETTLLQISVTNATPTTLTYSDPNPIYTNGVMITPDQPSNTGGPILMYSVSPPLPPGLSLDMTTGVISGTPTAVTPLASYTVTGSNASGSTTTILNITVDDVPPTLLSYAQSPATYTVGVAITPNSPSTMGGAATSWSVAPALPAGLSLDPLSGVITGTPTAVTATASYTVTAMNSGGSSATSLTITVNDVVPSNLTYSANPATFVRNTAITPDTPTSAGGTVVSYAISPPLPAGLSMDPSTGIITGTPTVVQSASPYTVTATNSGGSTTVSLRIRVNDIPPTSLTYSNLNPAYTKGQAIPQNSPTNAGGIITSYSVSPLLPSGLTLSNMTGVISGTPTAITAGKAYTITGTNSGGSTSVVLNIAVNDVPPSILAYTKSPAAYTKGTTIASNSPTTSGGTILSWSVSPALPAGLSLSPTTGVITGTPTTITPNATYTISATNSGGTGTFALKIAVNDIPPTGLTYSAMSSLYSVRVSIASNTPSNTGGTIVTYSVSPALPAGLSLNPGTGLISGEPVRRAAAQTYTVTGTNSGGSTTANLTIAVGGTVGTVGSFSAGNGDTCAIFDQTLQCWGNNTNGMLGTVSSANSSVPAPVQSLTNVAAVAAGGTHNCAISGGNVWCWGGNSSGELGNNSNISSSTPVQVANISGVQAISATGGFTCALMAGAVECWGAGGTGQLGNGASVTSSTPVMVSSLGGGAQAIATGGSFACAITNGAVDCWGANTAGELGDGTQTDSPTPVPVTGLTTGVQAIAAGTLHACALSNGTVYCWGENLNGQLGIGSAVTNKLTPTAVTGVSNVVAIAAGGNTTCALGTGGLYCWGQNTYGQVGDGSMTDRTSPVPVTGTGSGVQAISVGVTHTCAMINGGIQCWGDNSAGQLGNGTTTSYQIPAGSARGLGGGVEAISVSDYQSCAIVSGAVQCWGRESLGALGNGVTMDSAVPVQVSGLYAGAQAIAGGVGFSCAIVDGGVKCWGANANGQLGNNSTTWSSTPVQVSGITDGATAICAGATHACAVVNGAAKCWGDNSNGELGNNTTMQALVPVAVSTLTSGVQAIACGNSFTCAVQNGGAWCWGAASSGQLGNGTTQSKVPLQVSGLSKGVQAIAAGYSSACAIVDGAVKCWGDNTDGELGNNSTTSTSLPVAASGLSGVTSLSNGDYNFCASLGGTDWCWGMNSSGQYGDGTTTSSLSPLKVTLPADVIVVQSGQGAHTCAIAGANVMCWGDNTYGTVGDGTTTQRLSPVSVASWVP